MFAASRSMRQPVESRADALGSRRKHGEVLTAISDGIVALLKEFYGRGPTRTKTRYVDDLVVCLLRGGFSRVEQTLLEGGRGSSVIQQRMDFQELMRERFQTVIEDATGRRVIGFMSGNQQDPDIMCEVFILAPTDLLTGNEDEQPTLHEGSTRRHREVAPTVVSVARNGTITVGAPET
jgi:uncharacterized protein YbcI